MKMPQTVSVSELKTHTGRVLEAMRRRRSITVTHRRKEVARLVPVPPLEPAMSVDDPLFRLSEIAEAMGSMTNEQIDQLVYGG